MYNITHFGFVIKKELLSQEILKELMSKTLITPESTFGNFIIKPILILKEIKEYIILPVYFALEFFKLELNNTTIKISLDSFIRIPKIKNSIILKDSQVKLFDLCKLEKGKSIGGGIINLATGSGKTVVALKIISEFECKTLILVNRIELKDQWVREIEKFLPSMRIGFIHGNVYKVENVDVVIATIQSISMKKKLNANNFKEYGLCIIDELHNIATNVYSNLMFKVRPKYIFGLTATIERKDNMQHIIKWYLGDIVCSNLSNSLKQQSEIRTYRYKGESSVEYLLRDGTPSVSKMLTNISNDSQRNDLIVKILKELSQDPERCILVMSDRINQLVYINKKLSNSGLFIGKMKSEERLISKEKQIVLGTYGLVNENFNLPKLNTLLFATPRSSVTQAIGRIYRKLHQITPIIVDIRDNFSLFTGQFYKRSKIYKSQISSPIFKEMEWNLR